MNSELDDFIRRHRSAGVVVDSQLMPPLLAGRGTGILPDDLPLYVQLSQQGRPVLNFTHLRALAWDGN